MTPWEFSILEQKPFIERRARALAGSAHDAEDLAQDAIFRALKSERLFDPAKGCMQAWLAVMVYNLHRNKVARRTAEPRELQDWDVPASLQTPSAEDASPLSHTLTPTLAAGLAALSADQREAVWLADVEGLSIGDVARRLRCPAGTVKSRLARGRSALRRHLEASGWGSAGRPAHEDL